MTDWWAMINDEGDKACMQNTKAMIRAQNDLYMVTMDSQANTAGDNTLEALADGDLTRGELQRSARNICGALLASPLHGGYTPRKTARPLTFRRRKPLSSSFGTARSWKSRGCRANGAPAALILFLWKRTDFTR